MAEYSRGLSIPTRRAVITPLGNINLFKLSDIDNSYRNVKRFEDYSEVAQYFQTLEHFHIDEAKVVRVPNGIRLPYNSEWVREYNYIQFDNPMLYRDNGFPPPVITNTGSNGGAGEGESIQYNYMYAFITDVRWINIQCCEVSYEIDIFTTYFWRLTPLTSFIVRSHIYQTPDEKFGDNILAESVQVNTYVHDEHNIEEYYASTGNNSISEQSIVVGIIEEGQYSNYGGIFNSVNVRSSSDPAAVANYIQQNSGKVAFVNQCPKFLTGAIDVAKKRLEIPVDVTYYFNSFDGYIPKNKKCFIYPYNYMIVTTPNGSKVTLQYELFGKSGNYPAVRFELSGRWAIVNPSLMLSPLGYSSASPGSSYGYSPEDSLILSDFPVCIFSVDSWYSYVNSGALFSQVGQLAGNVANSAILGNPAVMGMTATSGIFGIITNALAANIKPEQVSGVSGGNIATANYIQTFYITFMRASYQDIVSIDNYFELFGYTTNLLQVPDFNIRPYWCYYQIPEFNFINETDVAVPMEAIAQIKQSLANGVTFWDKETHFGDYSKDNHTS